MVLETGVLPPPLQLYAAAAAHLAPRPPWAPLLQFPGAASLLGMPGAFAPLGRPRYPLSLNSGLRAAPGPPSEDSGSESHMGKGQFLLVVHCFHTFSVRLTRLQSWFGRCENLDDWLEAPPRVSMYKNATVSSKLEKCHGRGTNMSCMSCIGNNFPYVCTK